MSSTSWIVEKMSTAGGRAALLTFAAKHHRGFNVYHRREGCVAVLDAMRDARLPWWTKECSEFVEQVRTVQVVSSFSVDAHPVIVVEGLDGVGKSTVTRALTEKLHGVLVCTPDPQLEPLRKLFRSLDEPLSRAFYCGANYLAASAIAEAATLTPVVVDRWWCSTCAMAISASPSTLPPPDSEVYQWPADLPLFHVGTLLHVDESVRRLRMKKRNDENEEEALLAANAHMRSAAMEAYRRFGLLKDVAIPNYMIAVNTIIDLLEARRGVPRHTTKFTKDEIAKVLPF